MTPPIHRYPALYLALALAAGVLAGRLAPAGAMPLYLVTSASCALAALGIFAGFRTKLISPAPLLATALVVLSALSLGAAGYLARYAYAPEDDLARRIPHLAPDQILLGRVVGAPRRDTARTMFTLALEAVGPGRDPVRGRVRLTVREAMPELEAGQRVAVLARLMIPADRRNPADFSYREYLVRQGVRSVGTVSSRALIQIVEPPRWLDRGLGNVRQFMLGALDRHVMHPEARGILEALLTGSRDHLEESRRQQLARTGLAHLLAVSGLHVLLVGMLLYHHLGPIGTRLGLGWRGTEWLRGALTLSVLTGYALLVGSAPSVVRAVTMAGAFLAGHLLQRPNYPINALSVAGVALMIGNPGVLLDAGFQLSFAAVASIVLFVPAWQASLPEAWRSGKVRTWLVDMVLVSTAATLGTAPVMMHQFGQVALAGIVLNIPSIPAASLALASGILTLLSSPVSPDVASAFGAVAETASLFVLSVAAWGDRWMPLLNVQLALIHPLPAAAVVAGVAAMYTAMAARWRWRATIAAIALTGIHQAGGVFHPPVLSVVYFDIGQGDAALVRMPGGRTLLIDAGPADPYVDQGERTLLPHLRRYGIRRLDAIIITHPHNDHMGGLPALLRGVRVGRLLVSGAVYDSDLVKEVDRLVDSVGVPVQVLSAGDTLALDPAVHVFVAGPTPGLRANGNVNEASVVLRIQYGDTRFLFTGDAEDEAERDLVTRYPGLLAADVVKVGHHGSATSSAPWFVPYVATEAGVAVVSVAKRNRYGLPAEEAIARWPAHGMRLVQTSEEGALWYVSDGRHVGRRDWRAK